MVRLALGQVESSKYYPLLLLDFPNLKQPTIDDCAKDGGEEFFTKMHCVLLSNSHRIVEDL